MKLSNFLNKYRIIFINLFILLSLIFLPVIEIKKNRLVKGEVLGAFSLNYQLILILILLALIVILFNKKRMIGMIIAYNILFWLITFLFYFNNLNSGYISFSIGYYLVLTVIFLIIKLEGRNINKSKLLFTSMLLLNIIIIFFIIQFNFFDQLSLIRELSIKEDQFYTAIVDHMILSILAVVLGALISLPLGYFIAHSRFLDKLILVPLNLMQSIPTLSFFGLLFPILSFLGSIAVFAAIGITGIGWAPALIVLTAYTLLPIVRNTQAGYRNISPEYLECGKSLGMNKFQLLVEIELPLASPLIITGVRIALVQTIGAAVLAGLVGAGGLGSLLFLGLAQSSIDLIILSIIPIVFFTLLLDSIFKSGENIIRRKINDTV